MHVIDNLWKFVCFNNYQNRASFGKVIANIKRYSFFDSCGTLAVFGSQWLKYLCRNLLPVNGENCSCITHISPTAATHVTQQFRYIIYNMITAISRKMFTS